MTSFRRLFLLLLGVCGCFSEPMSAPRTSDSDTQSDSESDDSSAGDAAGPGSSASASDASGPGGGTPGSGGEGGDEASSGSDPATTADSVDPDGSATAMSTESADTGLAESTGTSGDESGGLAPYGAPCSDDGDCEGGICIGGESVPQSVCSVACDPTAGACSTLGLAAFCVELELGDGSSGFGCYGELDTGDDSEDGFLRVGEGQAGHLDVGDRDAFYLEHLSPGPYRVRASSSGNGPDLVISLYWQGQFFGFVNESGSPDLIGVLEEYDYTAIGDPATFPKYPVAVVSAAAGTSGNYYVDFDLN